jgi:hypothetical protein
MPNNPLEEFARKLEKARTPRGFGLIKRKRKGPLPKVLPKEGEREERILKPKYELPERMLTPEILRRLWKKGRLSEWV